MTPAAAPRSREQTFDRIRDSARRQLAEVGPAALSLRAIARDVELVPSALYRYVDGRDAILTELIRTGYERLGAAALQAEAEASQDAPLERWCALWHGTRNWAVRHPHEYALLYGSPVIGYAAPEATVRPATLVVLAMARILDDAQRAGLREPGSQELSESLRADAERVTATLPALGLELSDEVEPEAVLTVFDAWTALFGAISFELFGHYTNGITDHAGYLDRLARESAHRAGLRDGA